MVLKKMLVKEASQKINIILFHLNTFWLFRGQVLFHLVKTGGFRLQAGIRGKADHSRQYLMIED